MKLAFVLPALFLVSMINCQQASHYRNPWIAHCRNDEVKLGNEQAATCSPSCDAQACPGDYSKANGVNNVTPYCLKQNVHGHRYCALKCTPSSSTCPQGARCYKLKNNSENIEEATSSRDRALQAVSTYICLYDSFHELPGDLELVEDN